MAKNDYTADSASLLRLMLVQHRPDVTGMRLASAVHGGFDGAGTAFPTPRSSIV
jgi:hypothetical protein